MFMFNWEKVFTGSALHIDQTLPIEAITIIITEDYYLYIDFK